MKENEISGIIVDIAVPYPQKTGFRLVGKRL